MTVPPSLRCLCGAVNIKLDGQPEARANCHCLTCRDFLRNINVVGDGMAT